MLEWISKIPRRRQLVLIGVAGFILLGSGVTLFKHIKRKKAKTGAPEERVVVTVRTESENPNVYRFNAEDHVESAEINQKPPKEATEGTKEKRRQEVVPVVLVDKEAQAGEVLPQSKNSENLSQLEAVLPEPIELTKPEPLPVATPTMMPAVSAPAIDPEAKLAALIEQEKQEALQNSHLSSEGVSDELAEDKPVRPKAKLKKDRAKKAAVSKEVIAKSEADAEKASAKRLINSAPKRQRGSARRKEVGTKTESSGVAARKNTDLNKAGTKKWTVRLVGARDQRSARQLADKLQKSGYRAELVQKQDWFFVQFGRFESPDIAGSAKNLFEQEFPYSATVTER